MPGDARTLWTIGHSTHVLQSFLAILRAHRIETLALSLHNAGVEYLHLPALGGRRKPRPDSPNAAWRNESFRGYADYMETDEFRRGIEQLQRLATDRRVAIMCAEAVWWQCHRALISDWLKARGFEVLHILSESKVEPHPYTSAAHIIDGQLSYRAPRADATPAELPLH